MSDAAKMPKSIFINTTPGVVCGEFDVECFDGSTEFIRKDALTIADCRDVPEVREMMVALIIIAQSQCYTADDGYKRPVPTPDADRARAALRKLEGGEG